MTDKQMEAMRLADALMEPVVLDKHMMQAAAELRRLHEENVALREALEQPQQCKRCSAYATLVKAQEDQLSYHRAQADKYREAIDTLHSERQANAALTEELELRRAENAQPQQDDGPINEGWQLSVADGHSGYGVYAHMEEYPEEGAVLVLPIEQPQQEPVAWIHGDEYGDACHWAGGRMPPAGTKLYTTPPRREWVGLTDEEIERWWASENGMEDFDLCKRADFFAVARAIEAKLKEKNA